MTTLQFVANSAFESERRQAMSDLVYSILKDQPSPWPMDEVPDEGAASLVLSGTTPIALSFMTRPTAAELRISERGQVDFALTAEGTTGFLLVRVVS
jgi:hypothetical protein